MRQRLWQLLLLLLVAASSPHALAQQQPQRPGLTGADREAFIREGIQSCEQQRENPANRGISAEAMKAYCTCTINKLVDQFTPEEVQQMLRLKEGDTPPANLQAKLDAASLECARSVRER